MDNKSDKTRALEAILFIHGEPLPFKKAEKLLNLSQGETETVISELKGKLAERGLDLTIHDSSMQLTTKPEFSGMLESVIKEELQEELTPASLETLAIVSYLGPVPRSKIDFVRGVNSTFILRSLLLRGLVERSSDSHRTNVFLYKASFDLLRHLGINSVNDLPGFSKYKERRHMPPFHCVPQLFSLEKF